MRKLAKEEKLAILGLSVALVIARSIAGTSTSAGNCIADAKKFVEEAKSQNIWPEDVS